jgi:opacity protein-like surface antigen
MKNTIGLLMILLMFASTVCTATAADEFHRAEKADFFGIVQMLDGDSTSFDLEGIDNKFELKDTTLYGFGIGYSANDYINVNTTFLFGSTDIDASAEDISIEGDTDIFLWNLNFDYNILKQRFTPVLSAGIGAFHTRGELEVPGFEFDAKETDFTYNFGAGFRWDAENDFFVKAIYRWNWTKLEEAESTMLLDGISISAGFRF